MACQVYQHSIHLILCVASEETNSRPHKTLTGRYRKRIKVQASVLHRQVSPTIWQVTNILAYPILMLTFQNALTHDMFESFELLQ